LLRLAWRLAEPLGFAGRALPCSKFHGCGGSGEYLLEIGQRGAAKQCLVPKCALYPFRLGSNPWRPEASEATREVRRRNAAKIRQPAKFAG
jgi:hypothetical protein